MSSFICSFAANLLIVTCALLRDESKGVVRRAVDTREGKAEEGGDDPDITGAVAGGLDDKLEKNVDVETSLLWCVDCRGSRIE
jgi:hypothetical protein